MSDPPPYRPADRRPLAARQWRVSRLLAEGLARRGASPNAISVAGMLCAVAAGACLAATSIATDWARPAWLFAVVLIALRGAANMLDGMVAITSGKASPLGELFNEVPDRISDAATVIGLGYAAGGDPVLGYCAALAAVFTAYVRAMGKVAGAPQDYCGPMAKTHRMAVVVGVALYCGIAPAEWQPAWGAARAGLWVILVGCIVTIIRRLLRAADRLRKPPPCTLPPATGSSASTTPSTTP